LLPLADHARFISHEARDVAARPREAVDKACADRVRHGDEHDRDRACLSLQCGGDWSRLCEDDVGLRSYQLFGQRLHVGAGWRITTLDMDGAAVRPPEFFKLLPERCYRRIVEAQKHADTRYSVGLLPARRQRPRRRAADERNKLAPIKLHPLPVRHGNRIADAQASRQGLAAM